MGHGLCTWYMGTENVHLNNNNVLVFQIISLAH